jgi:hypothetical protein
VEKVSIWRKDGAALIESGIVLFQTTSNIFLKLKDNSEELTFEILIEKKQGLHQPSQLSFNAVSSTSAQFIFSGTAGPIGALYNIPIGTIGGRKLSATMRIVGLGDSNELTFSFWAEP